MMLVSRQWSTTQLQKITTMKKKPFDCVEMMHEGALRIYHETKGMTLHEELAYWNRRKDEIQQQEKEPKSNNQTNPN